MSHSKTANPCHHGMYGLTCAMYDELAVRSGGRCEICRVAAADTPRESLVIDHDRSQGWTAVRGLICDKCNAHLRRVDAGERPEDEVTAPYRLRITWGLPRRVRALSQP